MPLLRFVALVAMVLGSSTLVVALAFRPPTHEAGPSRPDRPARFADHLDVAVFQKGNLHTHSSASDGDTDPLTVVSWYAAHGYGFVALTDHNVYSDASTVGPSDILVIPGEEVTMRTLRGPVHVNSLCAEGEVGGHLGVTVSGALDWAVRQIRERHGVVLVDHPNYQWTLNAADLAAVGVPALLEIHSGLPSAHAAGKSNHPSAEALWDIALSDGEDYTGVAVDDAHRFTRRRRNRSFGGGSGWVQVFAAEARQDLVCDALRAGRLYTSSGPEIDHLVVDGDTMSVWPSAPNALVEFIGKGGRVLSKRRVPWLEAASYRLRGDEAYVRARITKDHRRAWTNAYRVTRD